MGVSVDYNVHEYALIHYLFGAKPHYSKILVFATLDYLSTAFAMRHIQFATGAVRHPTQSPI